VVAGVWPTEDVPVWRLGLDRWHGLLLSLKNEVIRIAPKARAWRAALSTTPET
jgi:hypothetical protein